LAFAIENARHMTPDSEGEDDRQADTTLAIADRDPLTRRALRDALEKLDGFRVVGEPTTHAELSEVLRAEQPEILVIEPSIADQSIARLIRELADLGPTRIVVFGVGIDDDSALSALGAGAVGVLSKDVPLDALIRALHGVAAGEAAVTRGMTMQLLERLWNTPRARPFDSPLTAREWEVLGLLNENATTQNIARTLVLSQETVYSHIKNILRKLGVHSRAEAVEAAARLRENESS
jgi:DNA-binding NarL/FixJ family response regulator